MFQLKPESGAASSSHRRLDQSPQDRITGAERASDRSTRKGTEPAARARAPDGRHPARRDEREDPAEGSIRFLAGKLHRSLPVLSLQGGEPARVMKDRAARGCQHKRIPARILRLQLNHSSASRAGRQLLVMGCDRQLASPRQCQ
jgi:hypothetical protein